MSVHYTIYDKRTGRTVQTDFGLSVATRSYWILVAHELLNEREPTYGLRGPNNEEVVPAYPRKESLNSWQIPALIGRGWIDLEGEGQCKS